MFFFKNHAENEAGRLVTNLFLCFKKVLYEVILTSQHHSSNIFW